MAWFSFRLFSIFFLFLTPLKVFASDDIDSVLENIPTEELKEVQNLDLGVELEDLEARSYSMNLSLQKEDIRIVNTI